MFDFWVALWSPGVDHQNYFHVERELSWNIWLMLANAVCELQLKWLRTVVNNFKKVRFYSSVSSEVSNSVSKEAEVKSKRKTDKRQNIFLSLDVNGPLIGPCG